MEENKIEKEIEQPNSVEISINAKGLYSGKVKVYRETSMEAMIEAKLRIIELEALIREKNSL